MNEWIENADEAMGINTSYPLTDGYTLNVKWQHDLGVNYVWCFDGKAKKILNQFDYFK